MSQLLKRLGVVIEPNQKVILVDGENSGEIMTPKFKGYLGSTFKIFSVVKNIDYNYLLKLFVKYLYAL